VRLAVPVIAMRPARATPQDYSTPLAMIWTPWFLRAICSIPSFGISEIRRERLLSRYQQKCQQNGRLGQIFACTFNAPRKFFRKQGIELMI
jgi:hypothetical protein